MVSEFYIRLRKVSPLDDQPVFPSSISWFYHYTQIFDPSGICIGVRHEVVIQLCFPVQVASQLSQCHLLSSPSIEHLLEVTAVSGLDVQCPT